MRVAALYDIHANLPALEAVLKDIGQAGVDQVVVGGDVFPGPMPSETLAGLLRLDVPTHFLLGNGDREVLAHSDGVETKWYQKAREEWKEPVRWTAQQLDAQARGVISRWPAEVRLVVSGVGEVLFCHATPLSDTECFTSETPEELLLPIFEASGAAMVVCGHTHMQFDRMIGKVRVVNAGSVGMPFGEPGAYWLLLGPDVEMRHVHYDLADARRRIMETRYPHAREFAENNVLKPPSARSALEMFARPGTP